VENKCIVETTGAEHSEALRQSLLDEGYPLRWDNQAMDPHLVPQDSTGVEL
jgi:hypothetical protein